MERIHLRPMEPIHCGGVLTSGHRRFLTFTDYVGFDMDNIDSFLSRIKDLYGFLGTKHYKDFRHRRSN